MPLKYAPEPENGSALVRESVNRLSTRKGHLTSRAIDPSAVTIKPSLAVYDLRADEVAAGKGLDSAHETGYHYLLSAGGAAVAAAEVHRDEAGAAAALVANINYGPFVEATGRALDALSKRPDVQTGSYEARLLRFSAIYVMAIWLKADGGGIDIVYPLAPTHDVLEAEKPYTAEDFLKAIVPLAKQRAESGARSSIP
jgi:hypothetical protein